MYGLSRPVLGESAPNTSDRNRHETMTLEKKRSTIKPDDTVAPKRGVEAESNRSYVYWEWTDRYDEGDSYIDAPCELRLYEDNRLWGKMHYCKNRSNPFTLAFVFQVRGADRDAKDGELPAATWRTFRTCTLSFGEGKSEATVDDSLDYDEFHTRNARRDISVQ